MKNSRTTPPGSVIPGWRVFLSDQGRFWASRAVPFADDQAGAGAERTVDGDTFDELRAEVAWQEERAEAVWHEKAVGQVVGRDAS